MRLARFNTMLDDEPQPEYWHHFFVGVPAPAAAALAIMPIMISFDFPEYDVDCRFVRQFCHEPALADVGNFNFVLCRFDSNRRLVLPQGKTRF